MIAKYKDIMEKFRKEYDKLPADRPTPSRCPYCDPTPACPCCGRPFHYTEPKVWM